MFQIKFLKNPAGSRLPTISSSHTSQDTKIVKPADFRIEVHPGMEGIEGGQATV
jgi:hypothetical protein